MSKQTLSDTVAHISRPDGTLINVFALADTDAARGVALAEAVTLATSGDTIHVNGNANVTGNLAKNGVNWYFAPGVTITRSDNGDGFIFDDLGVAISYTVSGNGTFVRTLTGAATVSADNKAGVISQTHASSSSSFVFDSVTLNYSVADAGRKVAAIASYEGTVYLKGKKLLVNELASNEATSSGIWWQNGDMNCHILELTATNIVSGVNLFWGVTTDNTKGDFRLTAEKIDAGGTDLANTAFYMQATDASAASWVSAKTVKGVVINTNGKGYVTAQKIIGSVDVQGGKFYLRADKIGGDLPSGFANQYVLLESGASWINISSFDPGANSLELVKCQGGTHNLISQDLTAATGKDAVLVVGGTLNLLNGIITKATSKLSLKRTGGTLAVNSSVVFASADTSGTITKLNQYGAAAP